MAGRFVKIISYGLIGESEDGGNYRHIIFEDLGNGRRSEYILYQKRRPVLWKDLEQLEKGKAIPPYKGYITNFKGFELVVLGDESLEEAFANQKYNLEKHTKISFKEADRMRKETKGFCTNLTHLNAMEYSWHKIGPDIKSIKFRYYEGRGRFSWSRWYEIKE